MLTFLCVVGLMIKSHNVHDVHYALNELVWMGCQQNDTDFLIFLQELCLLGVSVVSMQCIVKMWIRTHTSASLSSEAFMVLLSVAHTNMTEVIVA